MEKGESKKLERQWQEKTERPIAAQPMTREQIEEFHNALISSYKCRREDIRFNFEKIYDENDEDRDDCLWIKFSQYVIWEGKPQWREIFRHKIPVPPEIKERAEQIKKQGVKLQRRRTAQSVPAIMPAAAESSSELTVVDVTNEPAPSITDELAALQISKPKLRRPIRKLIVP